MNKNSRSHDWKSAPHTAPISSETTRFSPPDTLDLTKLPLSRLSLTQALRTNCRMDHVPTYNSMSGEPDTHTETESEDSGVALSKYGSDNMDIDVESPPTSASQSPLQSSSQQFEETEGTSVPEVFEEDFGPPPAPLIHWVTPGAANPVHPAPEFPSSDASFAEALSGSLALGIVPGHFTFPDEEETLDPANPYHQPFGMHQSFPQSLVAVPAPPTADEEQTSSGVSADGTSQSTHQHTLESYTPPYTGTQHAEPNIALPSLNDVFGSDFLSQSAPAIEIASSSHIDDFPADYWDDVEDNMKNFHLDEFFHYWKQKHSSGVAHYPPISHLANDLSKVQRPKKISVDDLDWEYNDYQGIHWSRFQTTKAQAREVRRMTYRNHRNIPPEPPPFGTKAYKARFHDNVVPNSDVYFHFQETSLRCRPYTAHFQLRHNLSASSKNAVFYSQRPSDDGDDESDTETCYGPKVMCFNPATDTTECAMDLTKPASKDAARLDRVTTLTASDGVLVAGGLEGVYAIKSLSATFETKPITGVITEDPNCSTNRVQTFLDRRSGLPQAVFDSNDMSIRTLDCLTNKFVRHHRFHCQINCSAMSPDGRLRLLVGDACTPVVANAETGEKLAVLHGHQDFGFACAWAPDGITMATGHQDGLVQVWDARKLTRSLHTLPMEMGGCRTMAFSPVGSGKRVLVLAEPADFIHVVDAQNFRSKQVIDFFGEISGISIPPDGSRLYIANGDPKYGGIMEFGRSSNRGRYGNDNDRRRRFKSPDRKQGDLVKRIMQLDHGESLIDKSRWDVLEERKGFKVGRSEALDWLCDDDLECEQGTSLSRSLQRRQDVGFGGFIF